MNKLEAECISIYNSFKQSYKIQNRVPTAIWDFEITLPSPPPIKEITNYGLPKEKRKFPYYTPEYKTNFSSIYDRMMSNDNVSYKEEFELLQFLQEEWRRRKDGFWFFNGDNLEYITGRNYMFLQYWIIPSTVNGRKKAYNPKFKDVHRDLFHCLAYAKNDPKCAGIIYTSMRRIGKTVVAIADGYFDTTENSDSIFAIQSKTEKDASKVFKKVVYSWQKLPSYLRPKDTGDTRVMKSLSFTSANKRNTKSTVKDFDEVLNSEIFYTHSKEEALDGDYCSYIINDESGKCKGVDVNERWNINKECLVDGSKFIGFGFVMTTVEDMEKYDSDKYLKLWQRSNPKERLRNGQTDSGLYQLFFPAYYGFEGDDEEDGMNVSFVDEWGYTDIERSLAYFKQMYEDKKGDMSYRRKYPIKIDDSFSVTTISNTFNQRKIKEQLYYNTTVEQTTRGNFYWKDGTRDGVVEFAPDPKGRWEIAWMPPEDDRSKFEVIEGQRHPTRDFCKTGCDPFSHRATYEKGSQGAATTVLNSHYSNDRLRKAFVCHYLARPEHPHQFGEDMILQCVFYSSHLLAESNKFGVIDYFNKRGYDGFCLFNPLLPAAEYFKELRKGRRGYATTHTDPRDALMDVVQAYIEDHIGDKEGVMGFCPFDSILKDWKNFEPNNWTPYDSFVSSALALIALRRPKYEPSSEHINISDWFKIWKK